MLDTRAGDVICSECGCVLTERLVDPGREWRDFADSTEDKSRVSVPTEYLTDGLGTTVAGGAKSGAIGKWQSRLISTTDKNLLQAFDRISNFADGLNIPETIKVGNDLCLFLSAATADVFFS